MSVENLMKIGGTAILRNPGLEPLLDPQLKRFAPTIFAKAGIEGVSESYGFVNTFEIIKALRTAGLECVEVRQSKRRDEERMPFTKHMLKFRKSGTTKSLLKKGDIIPQVVMLNSHDRSSGFHLYHGAFRLVCENGLMVSTGNLVEPIKVRHTAKMVAEIVEKCGQLIKGADGVYRLREDMVNTKMSDKQALAFARSALEFRPPRRTGVMEPATLLTVRREEDKPNTLWHIFNRVQENMMRGGTATITAEGRNVQTKGVGRIERDVQVNSALWGLAVNSIGKRSKALTAEDVLA